MEKIYDQLNEIFWDVFDDESIRLTAETTAEDIEDWDSLANINIIMAVEDLFGMKFEMDEIPNLGCVGDMVKIITERATKGV